MAKSTISYKDAGVNVAAGARWIDAIRASMVSTYGPRVRNRHGAFAGLFRLDNNTKLFARNYKKPVLVACADGVGTKILIALKMNRLDTIGIDLVAMNVNDLITCGAEPLFFLDYLAVHRLAPRELQAVVEGIAAGCREAGCALLGGETAEMPDLYHPGDLDLAGFSVGVVELGRDIDGSRVAPGDSIIALPSSGVHSNGYSLVRKLIAKKKCRLGKVCDELGESLGDALLRPTRIYVKAVRAVLDAFPTRRVVTGMAHITGGGLRENIARILPKNCDAVLDRSTWQPAPIFAFLQQLGVTRTEMVKVFNMGIGYVLVVKRANAKGVCKALAEAGEQPVLAGNIVRGRGKVRLR